ncbi:MAG: DUF6710 family protein [Clostridia bacterium]
MFKFFKKEEPQKLNDFNFAFSKVKFILEYTNTLDEKITILNSAIEIVKSDIIYKEFSRDLTGVFLAPFKVITENGIMENHYTDELVEIDLSKDIVISVPWNAKRFVEKIIHLKKYDFIYHENNHFAYYFTDLDITYLYNGIHSGRAGVLFKKGFIKAKKVNIESTYPYIYYQGDYAYSSITHEKIFKIMDYRLPLLFELGKMRYNLLNENIKNIKN